MTIVRVSYSDGTVADHNFADAQIAHAVFNAYQREVDHPLESCQVRGDLVPVKVVMLDPFARFPNADDQGWR